MRTNQSVNIEQLEGRSFIIGREGHIYIDSATASKHHAEISIRDGKIYLRDLDSTNGTFLLKNRMRVRFEQGFVNMLQPVVLGGKVFVIKDLLAIANDFVALDEGETEIESVVDASRRTANG
jgi:pSer/pThr/pTyr-binding forkhead associated (FHA) protein